MAKKLIFIMVSLAIVLAGAYAFRKLHYWERSIYIFDYKEMDRRFEGRGGRGSGRFDDRSREAFEGRGDRQAEGEMREPSARDFRERPERESGEGPDGELRERPEGEFRERPERESGEGPEGEFRERPEGRSSFGPGYRGRGGHGRGDSHGGKQVRLRNVAWFLVVFAAFTVVSIYLDRAWLLIRKKRQRTAQ